MSCSCKKDTQGYKDAVWSYLLEHCDVTDSGALFIKFHTDSRNKFEGHVRARWKGGYHRGDPKSTETEHLTRSLSKLETKIENRQRYLKNLKRGRRFILLRKVFPFLKPNKTKNHA